MRYKGCNIEYDIDDIGVMTIYIDNFILCEISDCKDIEEKDLIEIIKEQVDLFLEERYNE